MTLEGRRARSRSTATDSLVSINDVRMTYQTARGNAIEALATVDLDIAQGEFVSVIGPSGCGKSTLLHIVGGMRTPTSGTVLVNGEPVAAPRPDSIAFVFQDYTLFPWRTVASNVEVGLQFRGVPKARREEAAQHYLSLVGLSAFAEAYPAEMSGGMQQRVATARALAMEPELLLMDEPFGALDEQTRMVLGEEISRILERTGQTIMFVTHSLSEAVYLSDRVVVMSSRPGRIKEILEVPEVRPRDPSFMTSDVFTRIRNALFELLHDEFLAAAQAELRREGFTDA